MPGLEIRDLYQRALLWPAVGSDAFGQPTVGTPVEIAVRWLTNRTLVQDANGNNISFDGTAITNRDVPDGSHLWLIPKGTKVGRGLDAWYNTGSAGQPDELMRTKMYGQTPDLKNRNQRYQLGLMRLHDSNNP